MSFLVKNYNRKKISFKYGKGSYLYDLNGKNIWTLSKALQLIH